MGKVSTIISNINSTHLNAINELLSNCKGSFLIASPYLASDVASLLEELKIDSLERLDLITTFKPKDIEQITKPYEIRNFIDFFRNNYKEIKVNVHVNNNLHGKLYVVKDAARSHMIISSANFTRNGLVNNHEWGMLNTDLDAIEEVVEDLMASIEYEEISYNQIKKACDFANHYKELNKEWLNKPTIHTDILDSVYKDSDVDNTEPKYFLKPIGTSDAPILIEDKEDFSDLHQPLHFSKKKPTGVRKGDIVITTAIGSGCLLSYFKVTGTLQHATKEEINKDPWLERWPWYIEGRNQSQSFGKNWWKYNIRRQDALSEFLEIYVNAPVTYAGGFNLNTLNRGNDKVRITKEFGDFLISKITKCCG